MPRVRKFNKKSSKTSENNQLSPSPDLAIEQLTSSVESGELIIDEYMVEEEVEVEEEIEVEVEEETEANVEEDKPDKDHDSVKEETEELENYEEIGRENSISEQKQPKAPYLPRLVSKNFPENSANNLQDHFGSNFYYANSTHIIRRICSMDQFPKGKNEKSIQNKLIRGSLNKICGLDEMYPDLPNVKRRGTTPPMDVRIRYARSFTDVMVTFNPDKWFKLETSLAEENHKIRQEKLKKLQETITTIDLGSRINKPFNVTKKNPDLYFCQSAILMQLPHFQTAILEYKLLSEDVNFSGHSNGSGCGNFMTIRVPLFFKDIMGHFLYWLHSGNVILFPDISKCLKFFVAIFHFGKDSTLSNAQLDELARHAGFIGYISQTAPDDDYNSLSLNESDKSKIKLSKKYIYQRMSKEFHGHSLEACPAVKISYSSGQILNLVPTTTTYVANKAGLTKKNSAAFYVKARAGGFIDKPAKRKNGNNNSSEDKEIKVKKSKAPLLEQQDTHSQPLLPNPGQPVGFNHSVEPQGPQIGQQVRAIPVTQPQTFPAPNNPMLGIHPMPNYSNMTTNQPNALQLNGIKREGSQNNFEQLGVRPPKVANFGIEVGHSSLAHNNIQPQSQHLQLQPQPQNQINIMPQNQVQHNWVNQPVFQGTQSMNMTQNCQNNIPPQIGQLTQSGQVQQVQQQSQSSMMQTNVQNSVPLQGVQVVQPNPANTWRTNSQLSQCVQNVTKPVVNHYGPGAEANHTNGWLSNKKSNGKRKSLGKKARDEKKRLRAEFFKKKHNYKEEPL